MIISRQLTLCLLSISVAVTSVGAFSISRPLQQRGRSTCLFAEEEAKKETKKKESSGTDILNSPEFLKRKLEVLKSDLSKAEEDLEEAKKQVEAGKAEWASQLDELQKEYQNIQDRMNSRSETNNDDAKRTVAREMLAVLDNFDRAFGVVTAETEEQKAIEAEYKETYQMVLETFKKLGVEEIETIGKEFDYEVHQAVMQKPSSEFEEGIVCEEFQKGFKIGSTLVRAAMVAVAC